MHATSLFLVAATIALAAPAAAQVVHRGPAESPIATTVSVPAMSDTLYVSGLLPDPVTPASADGKTPAVYGDTETQSRSVFRKIAATLAERGMSAGDVVMMRVYLAAPAGAERMDFAGMMKAYREFYGTPEQPNKPARATIQVAALAAPQFLVEIEVTAAKAPAK